MNNAEPLSLDEFIELYIMLFGIEQAHTGGCVEGEDAFFRNVQETTGLLRGHFMLALRERYPRPGRRVTQ